MTETYVEVPPNSTGEKIAVTQLSNGADTVDLQHMVIADDTTYAARAKVNNADPGSTDYGLTVRPLRPPGAAAILSGQQAVTASAVALASNSCRKVIVKALQGNQFAIFIGPSGVSTSTGYELGPGESVTLELSNTNLVFVIAAQTGASVSWAALN